MDRREGAGRRQGGQRVSRQGAPRSWEAWRRGRLKGRLACFPSTPCALAKGTLS